MKCIHAFLSLCIGVSHAAQRPRNHKSSHHGMSGGPGLLVHDAQLFMTRKKSANINDYKLETIFKNCGDNSNEMTYRGNDDPAQCLQKCTQDAKCNGFAFGKPSSAMDVLGSCYACLNYKHDCSPQHQTDATNEECGPYYAYTKLEALPVNWQMSLDISGWDGSKAKSPNFGRLYYVPDGNPKGSTWKSPLVPKTSLASEGATESQTSTEVAKTVQFGDKTGNLGSLQIASGPDLQKEAEEGILQYFLTNNYVYSAAVTAPAVSSPSGPPVPPKLTITPPPLQAALLFAATSTASEAPSIDSGKETSTASEAPSIDSGNELRKYGLTFTWFEGKHLILPGASLPSDAKELVTVVNIAAEESFDADLIKFIRSLLLSPQQLQQFESRLTNSGVFKLVQFGEDKKLINELVATVEMPEGSKRKLQRMLEDLSSEEEAKLDAKGKLTPEQEADQRAANEENLARTTALAAETKAAADELASSLEEKTSAARGEVTAAAQAERERMQAQLAELKAESVNLDLQAGKMALQEAQAESGGYDDGYSLGFMELLQRNGIFRGLVIGGNANEVTPPAKSIAIEFTPHTLQLDRGSLESQCVLIPEQSTTEKSLEYKSATQMASVSRVIDSLGMSAAESNSISFSVAGGYDGIGGSVSASVSGSASGSSASAATRDTDQTVSTSGSGNEFYKLKVIDEPRAKVLLDFGMLKPSEDLQTAIINFQTEYESGIDLNSAATKVFKEFGTHVCPSVTLGGMWEIRAKFVSKSSKSNSEMSRVCTDAIQSAQTRSIAASVSASGYGASFSGSMAAGESKSASNTAASASKDASTQQSKDERVEVEQEWKGGSSGVSGSDWRASLAITKNSNWKIIDTDLDSCIAHWKWVTSENMGSVFSEGTTHKQVRQNLFDAYRSIYFPTGIDLDLDVDLANAWLAINNGGFEENSGNCATQPSLSTQSQKDGSCQGLMRCWQKGKKYEDIEGKNFTAKVGCNNKACCTKMADFPDGAHCCGFAPGMKVCAEGSVCTSCKCSAPTTTTTTTTTTLNLVQFFYRQGTGHGAATALCDHGQKVVGGGCEATSSPHVWQSSYRTTMPDGRQGWHCGGHPCNKIAYAICASGNAPISMHQVDGGDWTTAHCPVNEQLLGGGCLAGGHPYYAGYSAPVDIGTSTPGWKCGMHGGAKRTYAMCAKHIVTTVVEVSGNVATCPAGQVILGGGCFSRAPPHKASQDHPEGQNKWRCGGHSGNKKTWAVCGPQQWIPPAQ